MSFHDITKNKQDKSVEDEPLYSSRTDCDGYKRRKYPVEMCQSINHLKLM